MSSHDEMVDGFGRDTDGGAAVETPEEILATAPPGRDLEAALAERPRRRGFATSTALLAAIAVLAVGFLGGVLVGRSTASNGTTALPAAFPSGAPGNVQNGGGFTAGTVTRIDGDTVYVKTANGDTVKVVTNADTQIRVTEDGTLADLSKGSTVFVQGDSAGDGSITASSINEGDLGPVGAVGTPPSSG